MDKQTIEKVLINAVNATVNNEGWSNLAEIGGFLRGQDIKYGKLLKFIQSYDNLLEIKVDEDRQPPVIYTRLKENYQLSEEKNTENGNSE